jgi:hypothetical protein
VPSLTIVDAAVITEMMEKTTFGINCARMVKIHGALYMLSQKIGTAKTGVLSGDHG